MDKIREVDAFLDTQTTRIYTTYLQRHVTTVQAILDRAVQTETRILECIPGFKPETTFRAFPPTPTVGPEPGLDFVPLFRVYTILMLPLVTLLEAASLVERWILAQENQPRPWYGILPYQNTASGLLLRLVAMFVCTWLFAAANGSILIRHNCKVKALRNNNVLRRGGMWLLLMGQAASEVIFSLGLYIFLVGWI